MRIALIGDNPKPILRQLVPHTCPAYVHDGWQRANSVPYQSRLHRDLIAGDRLVRPRTIRSESRVKSGVHLPYYQAWRTKKAVLNELDGDATAQFQLIQPMLNYLRQQGTLLDGRLTQNTLDKAIYEGYYDGAYVRFKRSENNVFLAAAVLPTASLLAWHLNRKFLVFDGAHCSSKFGGILLIATTIDPDEETLILAWALVPSESQEWWSWFFELL